MKIKFCGMMTKRDIEVVNELKPDYIGFVFAESPRKLSPETAKEFKNLLDPDIKAVGVFVNEDIKTVANYLENNIIDIVQLHGNEDNDYINALREMSGKPIIKAFRVKDKNDIIEANKVNADYYLFDAYNSVRAGGTGKTFKWELLKECIDMIDKPFFLAGGLDVNNILEASKIGADVLDLSSGIETDGKKDAEKMSKIMKLIRRQYE